MDMICLIGYGTDSKANIALAIKELGVKCNVPQNAKRFCLTFGVYLIFNSFFV